MGAGERSQRNGADSVPGDTEIVTAKTTAKTTATDMVRKRHAQSLDALAGFSLQLGPVTTIPQFYYVRCAVQLVAIGPHVNPLGAVWYSSYILGGYDTYQLALAPASSRNASPSDSLPADERLPRALVLRDRPTLRHAVCLRSHSGNQTRE